MGGICKQHKHKEPGCLLCAEQYKDETQTQPYDKPVQLETCMFEMKIWDNTIRCALHSNLNVCQKDFCPIWRGGKR